MRRICVIGINGAGKTTFARKMAQKLDLPLVHIDSLYWFDNWQATPRDVFLQKLQAETEKDEWIIDGNNLRSLPARLERADGVVWLDYPAIVGALGALRRILRNRGRSRPDMGGECVEKLDRRALDFVRGILSFNRKNRPRIEEMLKNAPSVRVYRLKSRREAEKFLQNLR